MDYNYYPQPTQYHHIAYPPTPAHSGHSQDEYSAGSPSLSPQPIANNYEFPQYVDGPAVVPSIAQVSMINGAGLVQTAGPMMLDPLEAERNVRGRSSSEEKDMRNGNGNYMYDDNVEPNGNQKLTSAQRRKEQNRAAQRAFRERKERHVKELETKLSELKSSSSTYQQENEALKQQLQKVKVENEILRASGIGSGGSRSEPDVSVGPMSYTPTEFYNNLLQPHANKHPSHRITFSKTTGERLLGAGATWDLIFNHPLYQQGLVDPAEVCEKLKCTAQCDGQGPVFEESVILRMIEESAASGKDELI